MKKYKVVGQCFTLQEGDKLDGKVVTKPQVILAGDTFETKRDMSGKAVTVEDNASTVE
jgi:hypothetical protein